ncbi:MAG: phosphopyruvate hydratase [Candidatus Heimdallarchaeaceae archaeon]
MPTIKKVKAREVIDSRGNPTVEVEITLSTGISARAMVPSGASTGQYEALELRDKDKRFNGKGVLRAINNITTKIAPHIIGFEATDQKGLDTLLLELDGTENKSILGANAILGVSLATCKAAALSENLPIYAYLNSEAHKIPVPMLNVINGGKHAGGKLQIQEFMIIPHGFKTFRYALQAACEIYHSLKALLKQISPLAINVGDEGGFAPPLDTAPEALDLLVKAIETAGYSSKQEVSIGLDAAASEFYENGLYFVDGKKMSDRELIDYYKELVDTYPIISIEDPFDENEFQSFAELKKRIPNIAIVADDLTVTNPKRIEIAIKHDAANYLLTKVNQIGTLSEAISAVNQARNAGWGIVISHRSGETEDSFIADFSVGLEAERIKAGAPARGERTAKYNQLLRIEEELGKKAKYQGN